MELHAFDRQVAMAQAHDLAVLRLGAHRQAAGERLPLHGERVVARRNEFVRNLKINPAAVVSDVRQLAMHHLLCAHHPAAERLPDRLVPEADPEDRHAPGHAPDQLQGDPGLARRAGAGGDHEVRGRKPLDLPNRDFIVPQHPDLGSQLAQVLDQVVGERVVIVEHHDHAASAEATSAALRMARALCCVSCHSDCGSESATMPAAACTCSRRSLITAVRIAIATSMSPLKPRFTGSSSSMICIARTLGAPVTVPAGKLALSTSTASRPGAIRPSTFETMCMTCE